MDEELRALRTLALLLLVSGAVRMGWRARTGPSVAPGAAVDVEQLADSADRLAADAERRSTPLGADERLDPNVAGEADLDRLPGIGPALARRWIEARADSAGFRRPDDLLRIPGVGPSTLARIRPFLAPLPWARTPRITPRLPGSSGGG